MADKDTTGRGRSLNPDEIKSDRRLPRRSFLALAGVGAPAALAGCQAGGRTGITDADAGPYADPVGRGRGSFSGGTGITDSDSGPYADPVGRGRGGISGGTGITDSDSGAYADPVGRGRGSRCSGLTDSDGGAYADPGGCGRRGW